MQPVLSRNQIQSLDRWLIQEAKVPSLVLMENAGRGAAEVVMRRWPDAAKSTLVVCGTGNNGGDGFVVARHLAAAGAAVTACVLGQAERLSADAASMLAAWDGIGGHTEWISDEGRVALLEQAASRSSCVVDAIFGTGLSKAVSGVQALAVEVLNRTGKPCCSLDIPSGLDAETGHVLGTCVHADVTTTFGHAKLGLYSTAAAEMAGELVIVSLGVPGDSWSRVGSRAERFEPRDLAALLPARPGSLHKGRAGRVAIIAGSPGTTGAALLAARGALRAGAGLVTHVGTSSAMDAIESRVLEAMTCRLDSDYAGGSFAWLSRFDSVVIGPGLGTGHATAQLVEAVLRNAVAPVVVDADALTIVASERSWLDNCPGPRLLTPHPGEMARLLDCGVNDVEADRFGAVTEATQRFNASVLLKGPYTIVGAPGVLPTIVGHPNPVLAAGGMGDVLAGIAGALVVHLDIRNAGIAAAEWHSRAAEQWRCSQGADRGLLAHELADTLPRVLADLSARTSRVTV